MLSQRTVRPGYPVITVVRQVWLNTYAVSGDSIAELRDSLRRNGPGAGDDGAHFDALSEWDLHWSFRYDRSGGGCALAATTIEVQVRLTVPEVDSSTLAPALSARWRTYREAIDAHEQAHLDNQLEAADILAAELSDAPGADDCTELGAALAAIGEARIRLTNQADAAYDAATEHGRLQGAVLE